MWFLWINQVIFFSWNEPQSSQTQKCPGCWWIWSLLCPWCGCWAGGWSSWNTENKVPLPWSLWSPPPAGTTDQSFRDLRFPNEEKKKEKDFSKVLKANLFHSKRCRDLLAPEDHGTVGQDLGELIRVQPEKFCRPAESCMNAIHESCCFTDTFKYSALSSLHYSFILWKVKGAFYNHGLSLLACRTFQRAKLQEQKQKKRSSLEPVLEEICAPPAVMNSMFPVWRIPARRRRMSLMFSSVNCIVRMAFWKPRETTVFSVFLSFGWNSKSRCCHFSFGAGFDLQRALWGLDGK